MHTWRGQSTGSAKHVDRKKTQLCVQRAPLLACVGKLVFILFIAYLQALHVHDALRMLCGRVWLYGHRLVKGHGMELCGTSCALILRNALRNTLCNILCDLRDILQRLKRLYIHLYGRYGLIIPHHS